MEGYSVGRWEGDTLIVETIGQNGKTWLDMRGLPGTETLKVTERYSRTNIGTMKIDVTIEDPKAYTKPWTVTLTCDSFPIRTSSKASAKKTTATFPTWSASREWGKLVNVDEFRDAKFVNVTNFSIYELRGLRNLA
jgi:hypothetical protein